MHTVKSWCDACQASFERTGYGCDGHFACTRPMTPEGYRLTGEKELTAMGWREDVAREHKVTAVLPIPGGRWSVEISADYPEYVTGTSGFGIGAPSCEPPDRQRTMIAALQAQPDAQHPVIASAISALERAIP